MPRNSRAAEIDSLAAALRRARQRALYWSGNPSFTGKRYKPGARRLPGGHDEQYELAMDDIESLCLSLEKLTGQKFKRSDPKKEFNARYLSMMEKLQRP